MFLIYVTLYQDFGLCLDRPHRDESFILPKKKFGSSGARGLNRHGLPHSTTTRLVVFVRRQYDSFVPLLLLTPDSQSSPVFWRNVASLPGWPNWPPKELF